MKRASSGFSAGLPARWPQIDGIGPQFGPGHAGDLAPVVLDREIEVGFRRHDETVGVIAPSALSNVAPVKLVGR